MSIRVLEGFYLGSSLKVLFIRVPYYFGDLHRDPNLENYPYWVLHN